MAIRSYAEMLRGHAAEVDQLTVDQAQEFLRLLRDMRERLLGRLTAAPIKDNADFNAFHLRRVLAETEAEIEVLEKKAASAYDKTISAGTKMVVEHLADEVNALSKQFEPRPFEVSLSAAKALADPMTGLLASHFETSIERYGLDVLNGVRSELFTAMRGGQSYRDTIRNVAGMDGPLGSVGETRAGLLVRTEYSHALGSAKQTGLELASKKVPGLKKMWLHTGSYECPTCKKLHGTVRPINGTWTFITGVHVKRTYTVAHPPAHPHCVCVETAIKNSWKGPLEKLGYLDGVLPGKRK